MTNGDPAATSSVSAGLTASLIAAPASGGVVACTDPSVHHPLRLGSWNIQNYGSSKSAKPAVMATIGAIAARYDMLAIQELSQLPGNDLGSCSEDGETGTAACTLLDALNTAAAPRTFELAASPRTCTVSSCTDSNYNEQYIVVWDSAKLELVGSAVFADPNGVYTRDPWAAHLREVSSGEELALLSIHTPPTDATAEIQGVDAVLS
eukprot:SAG11_NODE_10219_length_846_cov_1.036145_2_plen_206_part_01